MWYIEQRIGDDYRIVAHEYGTQEDAVRVMQDIAVRTNNPHVRCRLATEEEMIRQQEIDHIDSHMR